MFRDLYNLLLILIALVFVPDLFAQVTDNFDSYIAGQRLACQNSTVWTTWSNAPCNSTEDPMVSNKFSFSIPNSVVITPNRDLIKLFGAQSSGTWYINLNVYIPKGKHGYFNILSDFKPAGNSYYAMQCIFSLIKPGQIRLLADHKEKNFPFSYDSWNAIQIVINLDSNKVEFWANSSLVHHWQWSNGSTSGKGPLRIDAINFFGLTPNDEMYIDDFWYHSSPGTVSVTSDSETQLKFILEQNYPNPFNPATIISYSLPSTNFVVLKIFNLLGKEIATLVEGEKPPGHYEVKFDGTNLSSGIYYYTLKAGVFKDVKKLLLLK